MKLKPVMKKALIIIITIFSLQTIKSQNVVYGVKGGANIAKFVTNTYVKDKYKLGFQIGGFAKIKLLDKLYVQPELLYALQGTNYRNYLVREYFSINESNIILPIMFKYYFLDKLNVELGLQLDYLLHMEFEEDNRQTFYSVHFDRKAGDFNWGLNIGAGYDFNKKIGVGMRYYYGFNSQKEKVNYIYSLRNSVFQISFEYRFN